MNLNHKNYPKPHAQQGVTLGPQELPLGVQVTFRTVFSITRLRSVWGVLAFSGGVYGACDETGAEAQAWSRRSRFRAIRLRSCEDLSGIVDGLI